MQFQAVLCYSMSLSSKMFHLRTEHFKQTVYMCCLKISIHSRYEMLSMCECLLRAKLFSETIRYVADDVVKYLL